MGLGGGFNNGGFRTQREDNKLPQPLLELV
jgi:hypothetical protein